MYFVNFHRCEYPVNSSCACQTSVNPVNQVHVRRIPWLFSQQSWPPDGETVGSITSLSSLSASPRESFHIEPCESFFITGEITFLFRPFTQSAFVSSSCVSWVCFKKLMCVGEKKLKSIILRSQFGHNIYNAWINNINTRRKNVFKDWAITLIEQYYLCECVCVYICVIDSSLPSAILSIMSALTELLHLLP